jgi:hypothetical protein
LVVQPLRSTAAVRTIHNVALMLDGERESRERTGLATQFDTAAIMSSQLAVFTEPKTRRLAISLP